MAFLKLLVEYLFLLYKLNLKQRKTCYHLYYIYTVKDGIHVVLITYKFRILSFSGVPSHLSYQTFAWVLLYLIIPDHERIYSFVDLFIAADRNRKLEIMKDLCDNLFVNEL